MTSDAKVLAEDYQPRHGLSERFPGLNRQFFKLALVFGPLGLSFYLNKSQQILKMLVMHRGYFSPKKWLKCGRNVVCLKRFVQAGPSLKGVRPVEGAPQSTGEF